MGASQIIPAAYCCQPAEAEGAALVVPWNMPCKSAMSRAEQVATGSVFTASAPSQLPDTTGSSAVEGAADQAPTVAAAMDFVKYYKEWDSIIGALSGGDTLLVRASWIEKLHRRGSILPRRQELPHDAIWNAEELIQAVRDHNSPTPQIIALSYSWLSREHPDPEGFHLQTFVPLLKHFARRCKLGVDSVALFIDWCSLPQVERSTEESRSFARALRQVHLWYTHWRTEVWLLTRVPDGVTPYEERGWTTFEKAVSTLLKPPESVLDVGQLADGWKNWGQVLRECRARRSPPALPDIFTMDLLHKTFSHEKDQEWLALKYRQTFNHVLRSIDQLWFGCLDWGDTEAIELATILPLCIRLEELELQGNDISDAGAAALAYVIPRCKALTRLGIAENVIGGAALLTMGDAWLNAGKHAHGLDTRNQRSPPKLGIAAGNQPVARQRQRTTSDAQQARGPPRSRDMEGTEQLSALLARQAAFEARIETAVARLTVNLTEVSDTLGAGRRRSRSQPPVARA